MEVLGLCLVTNLAAGITGEPLNHEEVLERRRTARHADGRPARASIAAEDLMRVLVTGAAGADRERRLLRPGCTGAPDPRSRPRRRPRLPPVSSCTGDCSDAVIADAAVPGWTRWSISPGTPAEISLRRPARHTSSPPPDCSTPWSPHDVGVMAYASSNHAVGRTPRGSCSASTPVRRPDTFYGVSKVAGEAAPQPVRRPARHRCGRHADRHLPARTPRTPQPVHLAVTGRLRAPGRRRDPRPAWRVRHRLTASPRTGAGGGTCEPGRALGYRPQDDAEDWASRIEVGPESEDERAEQEFVGGPYATARYARPPFDDPEPSR